MTGDALIPDRKARESAETTFDRNVVVVAGAGTGKTTLLVNRLVHLLMKEPDPIAMTQIVALTFTNKAAAEMKMRLRERLTALAHPEAGHGMANGGAVSMHALQLRYHLDEHEIASRAEAALRDLEKAQIGTLHSFAAHLLRLHPLESGVDPAFQEDDGQRFEEHFAEAWDLWIDRELGRQGARHEDWRTILEAADLESLRDLTRALSSELIDLDAVEEQLRDPRLNRIMKDRLRHLAFRARTLLDAHDRPKRRKIELMLAAAGSLLTQLAEGGTDPALELTEDERDYLRKKVGHAVAGWENSDFSEAEAIIITAQQLLDVNSSYFITLLSIIFPLVRSIRTSFAAKGWLSFDGLLARAKHLLWTHPLVRERIKREYRAVLVDEFQDTDPVQYDIILAVSERAGFHASDWRSLVLDQGKLFIVGDPKQSIYAFRRADIEAFDRVVQKIEADGGLISTLTTNFRSDAAVLSPVNDVFDRLFERRPLIQPANVRLEAQPQRPPAIVDPGVHFRIVAPKAEDAAFDAEDAVRAEGEALARWLKDELLTRPHVKAGHVALLFRRLTQADAYLDALRRHGIPYVIDGEKHFYRRQEVIDLVNVLRALDHPHDRLALAGVLRSPLGGCTDSDLYALHHAGWLEYSNERRLLAWSHPRAAAVRRLYSRLAELRRDAATVSLAEAIQLVFDRLPLLELAAASLHGEQAVANLLKVKQTAAALSDRPHLTFSAFVDLMASRLDDQPDEAESPLAEENSDAVQILTIHKAKGLEFPIVLLPGLHQGSGREHSKPMVSYDWSSGTYGLSLGERHTFGAVLIREKCAAREEAERRRVLYVGMTRAKDVLVLSGSITRRSVGENVLALLQDIGEGALGEASTGHVRIGASQIPHEMIPAPDRKWPRRSLAKTPGLSLVDPQAVAGLWSERAARWTSVRGIDWHLTPTASSAQADLVRTGPACHGRSPELARLVGVVAHRILERWNFDEPAERMPTQIAPALHGISGLDDQALTQELTESLRELLAAFGRSESYQRLRSANILGREVPFVTPWEDGQMMEGVIDVIYRLDGKIWLADYKTDRIRAEDAAERARQYAHQAAVYLAAAERGLGQPIAGFQFMFLRTGTMVGGNS